MSGRARSAEGGGDAWFALGLFVVALALRLYAAFTLAGEPVWDGHYYDFGARHIASGFGYADEIVLDGHTSWHPWCHYPVGYSAFLSVFYKLLGARQAVAHAANAVVGALLAVVTYGLAREGLSPRRAKIAGSLVAVHPGLVLYSALVMSEPLAALMTMSAFWLALRMGRQSSWRGIVAGALVLGVGALVRPQALLCAPFLATVVGARAGARPGSGAWVLAMGMACVVAIAPVLPWTARNCRVMDGCALVSTNAGWNLAIGAFPRATGRFETLRSDDGCREVTGQVQQDRCWFAYGIAHIRAAPRRWLALIPKKLAFTFDHESFAVEYLHEARPSLWVDAKRVAAREMLTSVHRALMVFASLAFVAWPATRRDPTRSAWAPWVQAGLFIAVAGVAGAGLGEGTATVWPLAVIAVGLAWAPFPGRPPRGPALAMAVSLLATTVLTHAVFFGEDRYHVVVTPILCLLAAGALRRPVEWNPKWTPDEG